MIVTDLVGREVSILSDEGKTQPLGCPFELPVFGQFGIIVSQYKTEFMVMNGQGYLRRFDYFELQIRPLPDLDELK